VLGDRIYLVRLEKGNVIWRRHIDQLIEVGKINEKSFETEENEKGEEQKVLEEKKINEVKEEAIDKKKYEINKSSHKWI